MPEYEKTSEQTAASAITTADEFVGVQNSETVLYTGTQVREAIGTPAGMFGEFGNVTAPDGWLACDGAAVSRATYAALFAAIGTVHGVGDGSTTFNVPDRRGTVGRGTGSHGTETMADGNPFAGPAVGAFEDDQMQGHKHRLWSYNANGDSELGSNRTIARHTNAFKALAGDVTMRTESIQSPVEDTDGTPRTGDETRGFAAGVLICIKT